MKIKFKSDNDLPWCKILNIPVCIIIAKSVFQKKKNNYYLQDFYKNVFISMNMNLKMVLMLLYKQ